MRLLYNFIFCLISLCGTLAAKDYQYELSAMMIFKDEAKYLVEWIEFHKLVGVQHFYLINHRLSGDNYQEILQPYIESGEVELFQSETDFTDAYGFMCITQVDEYEKVIKLCADKTKWLAIIDSDEFLFPVEQESLVDFLKDYEEFGGVYVFWQLFGTSGLPNIPEGALQTELFTWQGDTNYFFNKWGKSIVRPDRVIKVNLHFTEYKPPYFHVFPNKQRFVEMRYIEADRLNIVPKFTVDVSKVRINHYWTRAEDHAFGKKLEQYDLWQLRNDYLNRVAQLSHHQNFSIAKYLDRLKQNVSLMNNKIRQANNL